jgi:hypothetical protein
MNKILNAINKNLTINSQPIYLGLFELFYIKKYGSLEAAQKFFSDLKKQYVDEDEFNIIIEEQFESDFKFRLFQPLYDIILRTENFSSLLNIEDEIKNWIINSNITREKWEEAFKVKDELKLLLNDYFKHEPEVLRKLFIVKLADKITFTIKETREELGFKNQRTFKKWLDYFYKGKFEGRKTINILEYLDIWKKVLLRTDENKIDIGKNTLEYKKRLDEGLIFSKRRLKRLTKGDYKLLKVEIDIINQLENLQLPNDVDSYPFSIVDIFKKHLN